MAGVQPFPLERLTSYIRRATCQRFYGDTVSFLRAGGVDWADRSRDPDLLGGAVLEQVAAFLDLAFKKPLAGCWVTGCKSPLVVRREARQKP